MAEYPPRSPDVTVPDFHLWRHLKAIIYDRQYKNLIENRLKNEIRNIILDKRKHVDELLTQGRLLQTQSTDQTHLQKLKQKLENLELAITKTDGKTNAIQ